MTLEEALIYAKSPEGMQAARAFLSAAARLDGMIALRLARLDRLRTRGEKMTQSLNGLKGSGYGDKVGEAAAELADQEKALLAEYKELLKRQKEIAVAIARVPDEQQQMVLEMRYLHSLSYVAISMRIHCDERQAYRYHNRGLVHVAMQLALDGAV